MKKTRIIPRNNWVLVEPQKPETELAHGLIIPDSTEKDQKCIGKIIEVGEYVGSLKKGDVIIYGAYAGEPVQLESRATQKDQVDYVLVMNEDILALIV